MNANVIVLKRGSFPFFSDRKTTRENFRLTFTQTYILALLSIAFLGIYYVWILNVNATKGYNVRTLELQKRNLTIEDNLMNIKIAEWESLSYVSSQPDIQNMQPIVNPGYLVLKDIHFSFNR